MTVIATRRSGVNARRPTATRIPGWERFRGYGVMTQPFDSGHVLGLRVFPETDHGPFRAVWHRTPAGAWSMYVDAPDPDVFCPRYFGPILRESRRARIEVRWTRPDRLAVGMDEPALEWTIRLRRSPLTRLANRVLPHLPLHVYRTRVMLTLVGALADRGLGLGPMDLEGTLPAGHEVLVQPRRLLIVDETRARLRGEDLGRGVRAEANPVTGSFRWPARGVLVHGESHIKPRRGNPLDAGA